MSEKTPRPSRLSPPHRGQGDGSLDIEAHEREHQSLGNVPPIRRFELDKPASLKVIDGDIAVEEEPPPRPKTVSRRVDRAGRISILKHRYHVGRHLAGEAVTIESRDGLLHVSHNGVVVATHARRHLIDDDDKMDRRSKASKPSAPTKGGEVLRVVDGSGGVSFAGTMYRLGNRFIGETAGVRYSQAFPRYQSALPACLSLSDQQEDALSKIAEP